jgi:hypothetical protein
MIIERKEGRAPRRGALARSRFGAAALLRLAPLIIIGELSLAIDGGLTMPTVRVGSSRVSLALCLSALGLGSCGHLKAQPALPGSGWRVRDVVPFQGSAQWIKLRGGGVEDGGKLQRALAGDLTLLRDDMWSLTTFWLISAAFYLGTLHWCDRRAAQRSTEALDDLGFALVPAVPGMAHFSDIFGSALALWTGWAAFRGTPSEQLNARYVIFCVAVGNFFSTSLHTFTLMPSPAFTSTTDLPLMGGKSDKLMSNHVFCTGLVLQMLANLGYVTQELALLITALYSVSMLSTRAHYSVDIILAWWALAASHIWGSKW